MFTVTFEMLLFACQYEKFYLLYLTIVDAAWECFELERLKRHGGRYEPWCMVKRDEVGFSMEQSTQAAPFSVMVKNLGIEHPLGRIALSSTSEELIKAIAKQIEERRSEFSLAINISFEKPTEVVES